ncbi:MAG: prolyl oligopeptidase family serine peptidase [Akkermansiaceae bacterium]|nr:prolyl oligopeptidase family serine peptidase [Akkermansiaceae bacterium]
MHSDWTGVERRASPPAAQRLAVALVRELAATHPVDPRRLYLTGLSMGGFGVWDTLWREPELFAAALPICGGGLPEEAPAMRAVPTWAFHGGRDPVVPVEQSRRMVAALEAAGSGVRYTEFPDAGHDIWDRVYRDPAVLDWLLAQRR